MRQWERWWKWSSALNNRGNPGVVALQQFANAGARRPGADTTRAFGPYRPARTNGRVCSGPPMTAGRQTFFRAPSGR